MKSIAKLLILMLWLLGHMHGFAYDRSLWPVEPPTITYDVGARIAYNGDFRSGFDCNSTGVRVVQNKMCPASETCDFFGRYAEFLAAEGEGALAGSIRNVNPTGGTMNCVNCAVASDATLAGNAASALPGGPTSKSVLENTFGGTFQPVSGQMQIGSVLSQSGNGARGIVFGESMSGDVGHVFNVLNNNGTIQFLDGQVGGSGLGNFNNFQNFQFLLTHPGTP